MNDHVTIFEALTTGGETLKRAQKGPRHAVQNPKLDAQVLLSFCLKRPASYLFAHGDEPLTEKVAEHFLALIGRREAHEPIAYLLEEKEFAKRKFRVTKATLIPRPETELLIEHALQDVKPGSVFADIGTGSGAIAVTLAAENGGFVFATDISPDALAIAKENAATHGVLDRIFFLEGDLLLPFVQDVQAWLTRAELKRMTVVANLPYIPRMQYVTLDPDVKNFEPETALVSGDSGLDHYERLVKQLLYYRAAFPPELKLFFEIDPSQAFSAPLLIKNVFPYAYVKTHKDLSGRIRILEANI